MKGLLTVRDTLKKIYAEYDFLLKPVFRFLFCLLCLVLLKNRIGLNETLCKPLVLLILAAVSAFLPSGFISLECIAFVLANMYKTSLSLFLLGSVLFLFTVFLYFGFRPGKGILIILIPVGFMLKIPYVFPVVLGLSTGISAIVPVSIGVIAYALVEYFSVNCQSLTYTTNIEAIVSDFVKIMKEVFSDRTLYVTMIAFTACIIIVYLISRMNFDHCWTVSVLSGSVILAVIRIAGCKLIGADIDLAIEIVRFITAAVAAFVYELLFYAVDYRATEHLQFEDEDYYYYVKAVPKISSDDLTERRE